ncbi:hypothetical protein [Celeribacter sp.]|uniref:hypothetical protein n=1 Tax=Celeribacter sp. TaxID=1890673 RepID=UPI003A8F3414
MTYPATGVTPFAQVEKVDVEIHAIPATQGKIRLTRTVNVSEGRGSHISRSAASPAQQVAGAGTEMASAH